MHPHRFKRSAALAGAILVLAAGLGGCSRATAHHEGGAAADPPTGVILGPEDVERWISEGRARHVPAARNCDAVCALVDMRIPENVELWRPPESQVLQFERRVYRELERRWRAERRGEPLARYSVAYIGFVEDGRRLIFARGECGERDLRQGWNAVLDGGMCYFGARFDPATGEFGIGLNGVA